MEAENRMILRDLPVDTRNYTIIDNITGRPIDQSSYTLTIDEEVIKKLNQLKKINEEKVKQAALRDQYGDGEFVSTFTPDDNAVFTPMYNDEYLDFRDFNVDTQNEEIFESEKVEEVPIEEPDVPTGAPEIMQSDTLLDRVVARDPNVKLMEEERKKEEEEQEKNKEPQLDYISNYDPNQENSGLEGSNLQGEDDSVPADNSLFTPEMASSFQQASEQIVQIDTEKLGQDIKSKEQRALIEKIKLDKMEVISGRKIAWMAYILFFIPLLFKKNNRFVRIHANEGLELNIVELFSAICVGQYFLLPKIMKDMGNTATYLSILFVIIGAGLVLACAVTIVIKIITSWFGNYTQTPWLWKRRMIKVPNERTSD